MKCFQFFVLLTVCGFVSSTIPYCPENITEVKFIPKIQEKKIVIAPTSVPSRLVIHSYMAHEERLTSRLHYKCCSGYRMSIFGICIPTCDIRLCGEFQECVEPNRCRCKSGYSAIQDELSNAWKSCRPVCVQDCGEHAHCHAPNLCKCDENYIWNSSSDTGTCQRRCRSGVFWDPLTLECVERQEANVTVIAAEREILLPALVTNNMQDVERSTDLDNYGVPFLGNETRLVTVPDDSHVSTWFSDFNLLISSGVIFSLLICGLVARYFYNWFVSQDGILIEDSDFIYGEYARDRSQIFVC